jgi:RimJ/RimL family protein N-acetyltransferase
MCTVFEKCPVIENERFVLRLVLKDDAEDLLRVYSDKNALPFFNCDNCNGNIFYYQSVEKITELINFWLWEYECKRYVRFAIVDKGYNEIIGTIELFKRISNDGFNESGIMRVDVRSDYEKREVLYEIMAIITNAAFELFDFSRIATKAANYAIERIEALKQMKYVKTEERLLASDGNSYSDYWIIKREEKPVLDETRRVYERTK